MTRDEAKETFREVVKQYGLRWDKRVPKEIWAIMADINENLTERDRREVLGLDND